MTDLYLEFELDSDERDDFNFKIINLVMLYTTLSLAIILISWNVIFIWETTGPGL